MLAILRQLVISATLVLLVGFLPLWIWAQKYYPNTDYLDIKQIGDLESEGDQSSLGLYGYKLLCSDKPKIVFLGASGVMAGFRPNDVEAEFPGSQAVNLAVSGTNISGVREMLDSARATIAPKVLKETTFVIGAFFTTFIENSVRYSPFRKDKLPKPDVYENIARFGFYSFDGSRVHPRFSCTPWKLLTNLRRPFRGFYYRHPLDDQYYDKRFSAFLETIAWKNRPSTENVVAAAAAPEPPPPPPPTQEQIQAAFLKERMDAVKAWHTYMLRHDGTLATEQFEELLKLKEFIEENQLNVVLVDLPVASWMVGSSSLYRNYQIQKIPYFQKVFSSPNIRYINMQDLDSEAYFSDSVHIRKEHTFRWAKALRERWEGTNEFKNLSGANAN